MNVVKRVLIFGFAGIVLVAIVLWVIGGQTIECRADVTIAAGPEVVFEHLTNPESIKKWIDGVTEIRQVGDIPAGMVGARSIVVVEENGTRFEMQDEVLQWKQDELIELEFTSDMFRSTSLYELRQQGNETQIAHLFKAKFKGYVRLFVPFIGGEMQKKVAGDLHGLKELVESQPENDLPPPDDVKPLDEEPAAE